MRLNSRKYLFWRSLGINFVEESKLAEMINNRLARLLMCQESSLQCFLIVIRAVLFTQKTPTSANFNWSNQVQDEADFNFRAQFSLPTVQIVLVARKTIDEKPGNVSTSKHGLNRDKSDV